jgi:lambda family phage portal protein
MNFVDRAIGYLSPLAGLKRARARLALDLADKATERFRYDGAAAGRRANGWFAGSSDANVELMGALVWLRNRSRDLVRNNPHASKAIEELVGNTVGTGIVPQAKTGDAALDKIIDGEWPYFVEQCDTPQRLDFYGMQALITRSTGESGEGIVRYRPRLSEAKLRVPLQLQMLEADFLDQTRTMGTVNGHVMQGVEFDDIGQRVAYWLFSYHPGGVLILNPRGGIISQPVPAEQVLHVYRVLRPGQVRGVPWMTPSMMGLRDLDDYRDAEGVRKKIEACIAAFVIQPEGLGGPPLGVKDTSSQAQEQRETFEPGMIEYLKPGQDVKFNSPQAIGGYREYIMTESQRNAAGLNLPYELMTGDMSQVN